MGDLKDFFTGAFGFALVMVSTFPGGTAVMGFACPTYRLEWYDWLASGVIPFYGAITAMTC